jgi:hypothetical protein
MDPTYDPPMGINRRLADLVRRRGLAALRGRP